MPATRWHWTSATPVMFAGTAMATVVRPPRFVTKPWTPASVVCCLTSALTATSTSPTMYELGIGRGHRRFDRADAIDRMVEDRANIARCNLWRQLGAGPVRGRSSDTHGANNTCGQHGWSDEHTIPQRNKRLNARCKSTRMSCPLDSQQDPGNCHSSHVATWANSRGQRNTGWVFLF